METEATLEVILQAVMDAIREHGINQAVRLFDPCGDIINGHIKLDKYCDERPGVLFFTQTLAILDKAEIELKWQEALKPDKEKLLKFAATLTALKMPELLNQQATNIANKAIRGLMNIIEFIQAESNKL